MQFKFRHSNVTKPGELGFLVPYSPCRSAWPDADLQYCQQNLRSNTMFYLPFREAGQHSKATAASELGKQFSGDMQPEIVLFLRKARAARARCAPATLAYTRLILRSRGSRLAHS